VLGCPVVIPPSDLGLLAIASELLVRYAHAVDSGSGEAVATLFVEDGRFDDVPGIGNLAGRAAIQEFFDQRGAAITSQRRHHVTSVRVESVGDSVRVTSYFMAIGVAGTIAGVYEDEIEVRDVGGSPVARFIVKRARVELDEVNV
jgi:ketosteroid isomerase-like protein